MRIPLLLGFASLVLAQPIFAQSTYVVDPFGGGTHTTITAAAAVATSGDTILIEPYVDTSTSPAIASGYTEIHDGGTETFPIVIAAGVTVGRNGSTGNVAIWSSTTSPPEALIRLQGVTSGTAPVTRIEDLFLFGGIRGIEILDEGAVNDYVAFTGVIARCQFGWNRIAIDAVNDTIMDGSCAIRDCKIRSVTFAPGNNDAPNLQDPCVGVRLHAIGNDDTANPPVLSVEIRNLETVGDFDDVSQTSVPVAGTGDLNTSNEFSRLVEIYAEATGEHLEHAAASGFDPIPHVEVEFIGGELEGMADSNDIDAGWDVGIFATTGLNEELVSEDIVSVL